METLGSIWTGVGSSAALYWFVYICVRLASIHSPPAQRLRKEMWWVLVYIAAPLAQMWWWSTGPNWIDYTFNPVNLWIWWDIYTNDDHDDRWKKRRKKIASKIKQVAGKLIVVPIPSST